MNNNQYSHTILDDDIIYAQTSTIENNNIKFHHKDSDICENFNNIKEFEDNNDDEKDRYFQPNKTIFNIVKEKLKNDLLENLFTNAKINKRNELIINTIGTKRFDSKRKRFENTDNMRKKIVTAFLNNHLYKVLIKKLKKLGIDDYFEKFPLYYIKKSNKENIMNMTLKQFLTKKELYLISKELKKYEHNINFIKALEEKITPEIKIILNTYLKKFYEVYINSDEFKIDEIKRLKKKKMNDWYINRYIELAQNYLKSNMNSD